jgi:hypothetical protein
MPLLPCRHYLEKHPCGCELSHFDGSVRGIVCCEEHSLFNAVLLALRELQHELREAHMDRSPRRVVEERT